MFYFRMERDAEALAYSLGDVALHLYDLLRLGAPREIDYYKRLARPHGHIAPLHALESALLYKPCRRNLDFRFGKVIVGRNGVIPVAMRSN